MRRLVEVKTSGEWPAGDAVGTLTLAFEDRHRRRMRLTSDQGDDLLLDLQRARLLDDGDGLGDGSGDWWRVVAAPEAVIDVQARDPQHLARLAWHLGNRHTAAELRADGLRVRHDHVLESMLVGLGAQCRALFVPFQPERGAYDSEHGGHGHAHD